jgi:phospholipid/cholesterol/gamma-HCH transport system ATP-binding protein
MSPVPFARLQNVALSYGEKVVLRDLSLDVVQGAITCIIGLSGAGKSTVLRLINGLRRPDAGTVVVDGVTVSALEERELIDFRRKIGFAFQFSALFDSLTIGDNVALPLREHTHLPEDEIRRRVESTLESVGLAEAVDRYPSELSGGMVKRAGFARAVITTPECVLYDEPTTGQDPIITHVLTQLIVRLRQQMSGTAVVVSHDLVSIFAMADYVAMLFEGRIVAYGTVAEIKESPNPVVQQFLQGSEVGPIRV